IALDLIGHTRFFYTYAASAWDKTEDDLAYFRTEEEFRSARLVEQENGDFGQTIARQLLFSHYQYALYSKLQDSADETIVAFDANTFKVVEYQVDRSNHCMLRLGRGSCGSRRRISAGISYMWPYLEELFEDLELHKELSANDFAVLP